MAPAASSEGSCSEDETCAGAQTSERGNCRQPQGNCKGRVTQVCHHYSIDGFHGTFYYGNWRALNHHVAC